ncbi:histone PARylation factor 1 isoform X2 [Diachasma alloeum]|uniref:histone PARylation factor 1 isoform X2 n=1 Tax=Diachasma alloeum TaxID=454923 RepID=UPI0007384BA0|nr:histone PARylation factor 1 isoform X2 [Diachasma alloeum]
MADDQVNPLEVYQKDSRIACQYGAKCYQKNPVHHQKYKHPPVKTQPSTKKTVSKPQKRKINAKTALPKAKIRKDTSENQHRTSPTPSLSSGDDDNPADSEKKESSSSKDEESEDEKEKPSSIYESPEKTTSESTTSPADDDKSRKFSDTPSSSQRTKEKVIEVKKYKDSVPQEQKQLIKQIFLLEMPEDFYQFYEFCCSLSSGAPGSALRAVGLELVGPFDVLFGKIKKFSSEDQEKYLRHWRYFYDPPEFQTILKSNNKEGLHFGYWRDEDDKLPVFVARNSAMTDCKILPVAETIFGAVSAFAEERLKKASPFEKSSISLVSRKVKQFAKSNNISLELDSLSMRSRNRKSVTKTFHGAGIVVPYDKKTQVGYRTLAATDSQFKKILEKLEEGDDDAKKEYMSKIEEMVRLATIAADECDFGTPLELAHDLFSSGLSSVEKRALQMFTMSYNLLQRPVFSKIAAAHLKDRKKDCNLSVL